MGRRGPARTPKALLKLAGTDRKRKYRDGDTDEVKVPGKMPTCPSSLSTAAKAEWRRIGGILGVVDGMVVGTDRAVLAGYCRSWALAIAYDKIVDREGGVLTSANGNLYKHPAASLAEAAWTAALRFAQELGFSPASRSRAPPLVLAIRPI